MQVRRGEVALRDVLDRLHAQSAQLEHAVLSAELPDEPDHDAVNRFLVNAYQCAWAGGLPLPATNSRRSPSPPDKVQPLSPTVFFSEKQGSPPNDKGGG